jgi:hypothetical protein
MDKLNITVALIGTGVILIAFVVSLVYSKNNSVYMKGFFLCILFALLVSINTICGRLLLLYNTRICFSIQSIYILLDFIFWRSFFLRLLKDKKINKIIQILSALSLSTAIFFLCYNSKNNSNLHVLALINICKTLFCILYYHNLFKNISDQNILSKPSFWIVTGVLFYSCLSLPFYGLNIYIKLQFPPLLSNNIFSISNMLIIIMYIFFIKAFLCTTSQRKV